MQHLKLAVILIGAVMVFLIIATPVAAHELGNLNFVDAGSHCDTLFSQGTPCEELGVGDLFAAENEEILAVFAGTTALSCAAHDDPDMINIIVTMTNMEDVTWENLHYVADCCTRVSNYDGWVGNVGWNDDSHAFRIDNIGNNRPLIFESMTQDGLFEPGEVWQFILQDWRNLNYATPNFSSFGVACDTGDPSTGSIIACAGCVPEIVTVVLIAVGLCMLAIILYYRKRNQSNYSTL